MTLTVRVITSRSWSTPTPGSCTVTSPRFVWHPEIWLRLATNTYAGKDEAGNAKKHAEFHNLVAFGHTAEFAGQYLRKGRTLYVEGRLQTRSWQDAAGQKRYRTEVVVDDLQAVDKRPEVAAA